MGSTLLICFLELYSRKQKIVAIYVPLSKVTHESSPVCAHFDRPFAGVQKFTFKCLSN